MSSRDFTDETPVSLHWKNQAGHDILVQALRTSTARDVRDGFLTLAYAVEGARRPAIGILCIVGSRMSTVRLEKELQEFRSVVRADLGGRIHLAVSKAGHPLRLNGDAPEMPKQFLLALEESAQAKGSPSPSVRVTRQQVKAAIVERALCSLPATTMAEIRRQTGASYPAVSAALDDLLQINIVSGERRGPIQVRLEPGSLIKIAEEHAAARTQIHFADPADLARPPDAMARRLRSQRAKGAAGQVAIGGVIGGLHFFPDLDITAAPRLDLSVYDGNTAFVQKLDAALVTFTSSKRRADLVLHMQRDCRPRESVDQEPEIAARLDCLADLLKLGLQAEAREFAQHLCQSANPKP